MISICMATYNGNRYIKEQLESILPQMEETDELIICDDQSSDNTLDIINSISDNRIKVKINNNRLGHVRNFEKAISLAKNEIIVLTDQDDIWSANKLNVVRKLFESNRKLTLYHHGITTIDSGGKILDKHFNDINLTYNNKNVVTKIVRSLVKHHYFGCCMCFRKSLIPKLLPFPKASYAHDHWITATALVNGDVFCDNTSLISYRQHDMNVSPKNGLSLISAIKVRFLLIQMYIVAYFRKYNV
jgi:glycosyltransferase involved in cell wall biosynthesis